jgi:DNA-binding MarR family transcriptional regulator
MMTSQVLRALERRGLVERRVHPTDARARAVAATAAGRALASRAVVAVEACDDSFFAGLADVAGFSGELRALLA